MIEAVMLWNEPNNMAHWDAGLDPQWERFAEMIRLAAQAIHAEAPNLPIVLGGMSPIDPEFIQNMKRQNVIKEIDIVGVHGFPYDWNHWVVHDWPQKIQEIHSIARRPVWVTEAGVSSFGAEEVQKLGLKQTANHLLGKTARIHWYSLFDLPMGWEAVAQQPEAQSAEYLRHYYMGLLRSDGSPKPAVKQFAQYTPDLGICQWFHYEDHRLPQAIRWFKDLGVRSVRTGLNWDDGVRPESARWFDTLIKALDSFETCATFCFTPKEYGIVPHHTSPPKDTRAFADFCGQMVRKYAA